MEEGYIYIYIYWEEGGGIFDLGKLKEKKSFIGGETNRQGSPTPPLPQTKVSLKEIWDLGSL